MIKTVTNNKCAEFFALDDLAFVDQIQLVQLGDANFS